MGGAAVPEIPVLAYLVVGLLAMVAWLACRGLLGAYRHTFGYLLERLAGALSIHVKFVGDIDFGGPVRALDNGIKHTLSVGASKSEHAMGYFFHGAAVLQEWAARELRDFTHEALGWAQWLEHVHLPRWARWAITAAFPPALLYRLIRNAIKGELPHLVRTVRVTVQHAGATITRTTSIPYLGQWQWIHHHWRALKRAVAVAGAGAIAGTFPWVHVFPRLRAIERWEGLTRKRLRRLEALLGVTGLAIALANVLGLPNWRCLTRGNVGRTARALCGMPAHLLDDLLGLLIDFLVIEDICQVMILLTDAFALVEQPLADFAGAVGSALCHGDYLAPPALSVRAFTPPPLQARSAPAEA